MNEYHTFTQAGHTFTWQFKDGRYDIVACPEGSFHRWPECEVHDFVDGRCAGCGVLDIGVLE